MRRKRLVGGPLIPDWVRHESDGGFTAADWAEPDDFQLDPLAAESQARARWIAARNDWLAGRPDVADALMERLCQIAREVP